MGYLEVGLVLILAVVSDFRRVISYLAFGCYNFSYTEFFVVFIDYGLKTVTGAALMGDMKLFLLKLVRMGLIRGTVSFRSLAVSMWL